MRIINSLSPLVFSTVLLAAACWNVGLGIPVAKADQDDNKVLKVANFEACPYICSDGSGIFVDILRLALEGTGYEIELIAVPFERAKKEVELGRLDILAGILLDGVDNALYPDTWLIDTEMCFYVREDDPWSYSGVPSTSSRRMVLEKGIIHSPEFFESLSDNPNVILIHGDNILDRQLRMLGSNRGDTFTSANLIVKYHLRSSSKPYPAIRNAGCFGHDYEYAAISRKRKDATELRDILSRRLVKIRDTAAYQELLRYYKGSP